MPTLKRKFVLPLVPLLSTIVFAAPGTQGPEYYRTPGTIEELRAANLTVLRETHTPAAGIALVNKEGPVWIEGLGKADRESGIEADEGTMFRIGSTSKIFVALAVLKLQELGRLDLKDRVRDIIPEIKFENKWEDTNPVLIEHLLEHTTGWDDLHLVEYDQKGPEAVPLKEALDFHPHSRISRWVPGTRMSYCNTGPNVAAYIVEKIAGSSFEEYVAENFFSPMGIETMTYRFSEDYKRKGAALYREGTRSDYWHMLMRASGSINASPKDMARMLQLFVSRGKIESTRIISSGSLRRMETPSTTSGARAGLKYGYGLCLYTSPHNGFIYYKHGGDVGNGISDFSYLPEYGLGYSILINSDNVTAIRELARLIRNFQTRNLSELDKETPAESLDGSRHLSGYYQPINPHTDILNLPPLIPCRIWTESDTLYMQDPAFFGDRELYVAVSHNLYQSVTTGRAELIFVGDPLAGEAFELAHRVSGTMTLASIPANLVLARILMLILWMLFILHAFFSLPIWLFRCWRRNNSAGAYVQMRMWSLLPVGFLALAFLLLVSGAMDGIEPLAEPSFFSIGFMVGTIVFFASTIYSIIVMVRYRNREVKKSVYLSASILCVLHCLVAFYLLWHGVIGLMTWA